ncbi:MAG: GAF domain-containing protein [Acidobacteria bacterium]|nr:GAF domain-containing protein [Acidobacteriota bacterium]
MTERLRDLDSPGGPGTPSRTVVLQELKASLLRAGSLVENLETRIASGAEGDLPEAAAERIAELEERLEATEQDVQELSSRLVDSEHHAGRLMNLYVATFQLHANLDPDEVQATIAEIAINLLGAERFVLLLRKDSGTECDVALSEGCNGSMGGLYSDGRYLGGDAMVDSTLEDGVLRIGPEKGSTALAAVPLRVEEEIVGALVLLKLLDHKPVLRPEDRDLLDLLSAHAASALFAARLFATKDRKLRTLESLVKLARGE